MKIIIIFIVAIASIVSQNLTSTIQNITNHIKKINTDILKNEHILDILSYERKEILI